MFSIRNLSTLAKCLKCKRYCWNCGKCLNKLTLVCKESCGAVQPVENEFIKEIPSYLLEKYQFDIDYQELRNKFLQLQRNIHPDLFSHKDEKWKEYASQQSQLLLKTYHTLKDPYSRSLYLLHNLGIEPSTSERDQGHLAQVMQVWEELDSVETPLELEKFQDKIQSKIQETVQEISKNYKVKNYQKVYKLTVELKYWYSIRDQVLNMELGKIQNLNN